VTPELFVAIAQWLAERGLGVAKYGRQRMLENRTVDLARALQSGGWR
jgi:hypothetical protein